MKNLLDFIPNPSQRSPAMELPNEWIALLALVFVLGAKHGLDADHLATIDGLTRHNLRIAPARALELADEIVQAANSLTVASREPEGDGDERDR